MVSLLNNICIFTLVSLPVKTLSMRCLASISLRSSAICSSTSVRSQRRIRLPNIHANIKYKKIHVLWTAYFAVGSTGCTGTNKLSLNRPNSNHAFPSTKRAIITLIRNRKKRRRKKIRKKRKIRKQTFGGVIILL